MFRSSEVWSFAAGTAATAVGPDGHGPAGLPARSGSASALPKGRGGAVVAHEGLGAASASASTPTPRPISRQTCSSSSRPWSRHSSRKKRAEYRKVENDRGQPRRPHGVVGSAISTRPRGPSRFRRRSRLFREELADRRRETWCLAALPRPERAGREDEGASPTLMPWSRARRRDAHISTILSSCVPRPSSATRRDFARATR